MLFSCERKPADTIYDPETLMTESSEHRTVIMSENGRISYEFTTPLIEGYAMAANPYREFRRGVEIKTFTSDTLPLVDATLRANYAIYYENQKLWEAKGNVVIYKYNRNEADTTVVSHTEIYTQQLFWNAKTKQIYSNVDTKVLQNDGWHFGVGFDADESLKNIHFRKYSSEMAFDVTDEEQGSSSTGGGDGSAATAAKQQQPRQSQQSRSADEETGKRSDATVAPAKTTGDSAPQSISAGGHASPQPHSSRENVSGEDKARTSITDHDRTLQREMIDNSATVQRQNVAK